MGSVKEAIVEAKGICKSYGEVPILKGITLDLYKGEWTNIMGPSGSGKTTLLNIMSCLDKSTEGRLNINGIDITGMSKQQLAHFRREMVGLIF